MENASYDPTLTEELLRFFKALSQPERLKVLGLLANEPRSLADLSQALNARPADSQRYLGPLIEIGLVEQQGDSAYRFNAKHLEEMARQVLSGLEPRLTESDFEGEAYDRKVLSDFFLPDGRLKSIPSQEKKLLVVLGHIADSFEPDIQYTEKEVNVILARFFNDSVSLRRYLITYRFLGRDNKGQAYWRIPD